MSVAATAITVGARAGDTVQESAFLLPLAATTEIPAACISDNAASKASDDVPTEKDKLDLRGGRWGGDGRDGEEMGEMGRG